MILKISSTDPYLLACPRVLKIIEPALLRTSWEKIWHDACNFQLRGDHDTVVLKLGKSNMFTVKSVYNGLSKSESGIYRKRIWKGKIPAKIKIFLWLMTNNAILTKDNLQKRK